MGNAVQPAAPVLPCKVGVPVLLELLPQPSYRDQYIPSGSQSPPGEQAMTDQSNSATLAASHQHPQGVAECRVIPLSSGQMLNLTDPEREPGRGKGKRRPGRAPPPDRIHPRPGDGQIRDSTLSLRRPNPGRDQGHVRDNPRASLPACPGGTDEGDAPSLRRTRPTPTSTNTRLWKYWPARWIPRSAGTPRYVPAEPSGSWTRRGNPTASGTR